MNRSLASSTWMRGQAIYGHMNEALDFSRTEHKLRGRWLLLPRDIPSKGLSGELSISNTSAAGEFSVSILQEWDLGAASHTRHLIM